MFLKKGLLFFVFSLIFVGVAFSENVSAWEGGCESDGECSDGNICNGIETCNWDLGCLPGTPLVCNNEFYCDGVETCNEQSGCVDGEDVVCGENDQNLCTTNSCDEETDSCVLDEIDCSELDNMCGNGVCNPDTGLCENDLSLDVEGPETSDLVVTKTINACNIDVEATETDECSPIAEAEYFLGGSIASCNSADWGDGYGFMNVLDGDYDELVEAVLKNSAGNSLQDGSLNVHVRGKDALGNIGVCETVNIALDCLPPEYPTCEPGQDVDDERGIALNGQCNPQELLVCDNDPLLTANICDKQSTIQLAEYFIDENNPFDWEGIPMDAVDGNYLDENCEDVQATINLDELSEGTHYVQLHGKDEHETWGKLDQPANPLVSFIKDTLPPVTEKTIEFADEEYAPCEYSSANGYQLTDGCYYVKPGTKITLSATDPDPQGTGEFAGNEVINWRVWYSQDCTTEDPEWILNASGTGNLNEDVVLTLNEDSCHLVEYWASDGCYNEEVHHYELDIVDSKAPEVVKNVSGTFVQGDGNPVHYYLGSESLITLDCADQSPHPVGQETLYWNTFWSEDCDVEDEEAWEQIGESSSENGHAEIVYQESSCHKLVYWCVDALGNSEEPQIEIDAVDVVPPTIEKTIVGPQYGQCPPEPQVGDYEGNYQEGYNDYCYIDNATIINVTAYDPDPHPSGLDDCYYWYYVYPNFQDYYSDENGVRFPSNGHYSASLPIIHFPEESIHELHLVCKDNLGNRNEDIETFVVDHSAPYTTKSFEGPLYSCEGEGCYYNEYFEESFPLWISRYTDVILWSYDSEPHPSGVNTLHYRTTVVDDYYCQTGNEEKEIPESYCDDAQGYGEWTQVDSESEEWQSSLHTSFRMQEDSCHLIEYYAVDNVEKTEVVKKQCVFVDTKAPETDKIIGEPKYPCEVEGKCSGESEIQNVWTPWFVTSQTPITLSCDDVDPHPVGYEQLCFKISWDEGEEIRYITERYIENNEAGSWDNNGYYCVYTENGDYTFNFLEDSLHNIEWYCSDALGNRGEEQIEWDNVDSEPPKIIIRNPTLNESGDVKQCVQSVVVTITDAKSGVDESSVVAELWNDEEELVKSVNLTKSVYGTYEGLMEKDLPAGDYTLIIKAKDNLGNEAEVSRSEYLPETVFVEYISPSSCYVDPVNGGSCEFDFHLCMRGGNTVEFWMDKLGNIITPDMMSAETSDTNESDFAFVGLRHIIDDNEEQCTDDNEEWDSENGVCWFTTEAGDLQLEETCVDINGRAVFELHLDLDSDVVQAIGAGVQDLEYWIKTSLMCIG